MTIRSLWRGFLSIVVTVALVMPRFATAAEHVPRPLTLPFQTLSEPSRFNPNPESVSGALTADMDREIVRNTAAYREPMVSGRLVNLIAGMLIICIIHVTSLALTLGQVAQTRPAKKQSAKILESRGLKILPVDVEKRTLMRTTLSNAADRILELPERNNRVRLSRLDPQFYINRFYDVMNSQIPLEPFGWTLPLLWAWEPRRFTTDAISKWILNTELMPDAVNVLYNMSRDLAFDQRKRLVLGDWFNQVEALRSKVALTLEYLTSASSEERKKAAKTLALLQIPEDFRLHVMAELFVLLKDPDPELRRIAAAALVRLIQTPLTDKDCNIIDNLISAGLSDPDPTTTEIALTPMRVLPSYPHPLPSEFTAEHGRRRMADLEAVHLHIALLLAQDPSKIPPRLVRNELILKSLVRWYLGYIPTDRHDLLFHSHNAQLPLRVEGYPFWAAAVKIGFRGYLGFKIFPVFISSLFRHRDLGFFYFSPSAFTATSGSRTFRLQS